MELRRNTVINKKILFIVPLLMACGISQALVTTMLGLIVAIPLVFLHSVLTSWSGTLIEVLEEQSAGLIARHAERSSR